MSLKEEWRRSRLQRENDQAVRALLRGCDPGPLLTLAPQFNTISGFLALEHPVLFDTIFFNYIYALLASGEGIAVLENLEQLTDAGVTAGVAQRNFCVISCLRGQAFTSLERWEEAVAEQNKAMEIFNRLPPNMRFPGSITFSSLQWQLCANGYAIRIHRGELEGLEPLLVQLLEGATYLRWQIEAWLLLGKFHLKEGEPQKGKEYLETVVAQGNRLHAKQEAAELLGSLRGHSLTGAQLAQKALRQAGSYDALDPAPALAICQETLQRPEVLAEKLWTSLLRICAATALINLGQYDKAREELDKVRLTPELEQLRPTRVSALLLWLILSTTQGDLHAARRYLGQLEPLCPPENTPTGTLWSLERGRCALLIQEGSLEGVEARAQALLEGAGDRSARVFAHMVLAQYYLAAGQREKAQPHLEYVAQRGGSHHFCAEAQVLLASIF